LNLLVLVFYWLSVIVSTATIIFAALFFLRAILKWMNVNPFAKIPYHLTRITEPMVRPLRSQFGGPVLRYDLFPLLVGILILTLGLSLSSLIWQLGLILSAIVHNLADNKAVSWVMAGELIKLAGLFYVVAIFLRFFLPFLGVGYHSNFFRFLFRITEPLIKPLRRFFVLGMFDLSPLIAMFLIQFLTPVIAEMVANIGR
jgi:uncharacterized protein YggT (Ycf19 family)